MLTNYKTHMRPIVEYACPFWHAGLTKDQPNKLEGIKKRALQVILGDTLLPYEECFVLSGLTTLETRRHELLMGFGYGFLSSQKHHDILPPNKTSTTPGTTTSYSHTTLEQHSNAGNHSDNISTLILIYSFIYFAIIYFDIPQ